jgi:hypothetical protein
MESAQLVLPLLGSYVKYPLRIKVTEFMGGCNQDAQNEKKTPAICMPFWVFDPSGIFMRGPNQHGGVAYGKEVCVTVPSHS